MDTVANTRSPLLDMKCLVITGEAGSGKDTLANAIMEWMPDWDIYSLKFSKSLKLACCAIYGWDYNLLDLYEYKEERDPNTNKKRRDHLKEWGMLGRNRVGLNVWADAAIREACDGSIFHDAAISTDCRFANEQEILEREFGKTLFVRLHKVDPLTAAGVAVQRDPFGVPHPSEDLSDLDIHMEFHAGDGDLRELSRIARFLAEGFFHDLR